MTNVMDFEKFMRENGVDEGSSTGKGSSKKATSSGTSKSTSSLQPRCYESHPAYEIVPGKFIYGGSCSWPKVKDADVYGGFDGGMRFDKIPYPWSPKTCEVIEFKFSITDMQPPVNQAEFQRMIVWLAEQVNAGKKVHLGCIGGHGRTGTVLSALRKHMTGDEDATTHVRTNYCKKAVESQSQVDWLHKHYGIKKVPPVKSFGNYGSTGYGGSSKKSELSKYTDYGGGSSLPLPLPKHTPESFDDYQQRTGKPVKASVSIWGDE